MLKNDWRLWAVLLLDVVLVLLPLFCEGLLEGAGPGLLLLLGGRVVGMFGQDRKLKEKEEANEA